LRLFGPKNDEVAGEVRKIHIDKLDIMYCPSNNICVIKSRRMRRAGHVALMVASRILFMILVGKPECKFALGRTRHKYRNNIKMNHCQVRIQPLVLSNFNLFIFVSFTIEDH
jgi:hypothetical protein